MQNSKISALIQKRKSDKGDYLADVIIDICFATSYKIEELLIMPPKRLDRLIERYKERFCKQK